VAFFEARVSANRPLGRGGFVLHLDGCEALAGAQPGQFVMLRAAWGRDPLLPRAFSILRTTDGGGCQILVKAIGRATRLLEHLAVGTRLSLLGPLGRPFSPTPNPGPGDYLVAGGVGLAPLLWFAERYPKPGVHMFYGARTAADLVLLDEARAACAFLTLATEDGSSPPGGPTAVHGRVTDALARQLPRRSHPGTRILTCGPNAMMRAVAALAADQVTGRAEPQPVPCLVSVEGEMACGIGACLGCAVPTVGGERPFAYACVDGPVFDARAIVIP
jgi:dihydroorotate dehydrogenase electron transfer subunit